MTRFVPISEHDDDERPSKTSLKKQAHEQQTLGEALAALAAWAPDSATLEPC